MLLLDPSPTLGQALVLAEAHLRVIGMSEFSPMQFVKTCEVSAGVTTLLREAEVLPGLRLQCGSSILEVVKVIPTNKEVIYKSVGGVFRMPTAKFVQLAIQQGYRKSWDVEKFLISLKNLLKPVLDSVPLMLVMTWVLSQIRGEKPSRIEADHFPSHSSVSKPYIMSLIAKVKSKALTNAQDVEAEVNASGYLLHDVYWTLLKLFKKGEIGWEDGLALFQDTVKPKGSPIFKASRLRNALINIDAEDLVPSFNDLK